MSTITSTTTTTAPSTSAHSQYAHTSSRLSLRAAILSYDTYPIPWYSWLAPRLPIAHSDILEVGSGTGSLWRHIPSADLLAARSITLTDFSDAMCATLKTDLLPSTFNTPGNDNDKVRVQRADAEHLPFPPASFDLVIANHMLYHVDSPAAALAEFARVLRPGGCLRVALNGADHIQELLDLGKAVGRESPIVGPARISAETAAGVIAEVGVGEGEGEGGGVFGDVEAERFPGRFEVPEPGPVLGYLESWGEGKMDEEVERRAKGLVEERIREEGMYGVKKHMVLFSAVRR